MLKRKLYSTGLLVYCFLILITATNQKVPFNGSIKSVVADTSVISNEPVFTLPDFAMNPSALEFAKVYVEKNNWGLERLKKNNQSLLAIINSVFEKKGIPGELKYMAIVESNLNTDTVCSSTGATGIWQLMPETACELGLRITNDCDERLNVHKSSAAVTKYLKQLYAEFGDWLLVIAAYNSGPAKVTRAIQLSGNRNFWQLENFLPAETRNHVKRFISLLYFFEEQNSTPIQQNGIVRQTTSPDFSNIN